jgi:hypothetical protein
VIVLISLVIIIQRTPKEENARVGREGKRVWKGGLLEIIIFS